MGTHWTQKPCTTSFQSESMLTYLTVSTAGGADGHHRIGCTAATWQVCSIFLACHQRCCQVGEDVGNRKNIPGLTGVAEAKRAALAIMYRQPVIRYFGSCIMREQPGMGPKIKVVETLLSVPLSAKPQAISSGHFPSVLLLCDKQSSLWL